MDSNAKFQGIDQVVNISTWRNDDEVGDVFPEGSREKTLYIAPKDKMLKFIIPDHKYLFKLSFARYPEQFWGEIIAYKIGTLIGIEVPPTFVAIDENTKKTGALIEWFINYPSKMYEVKISGASYMQLLIRDYDLEKGKQHNFQAIKTLHIALKKHFGWNFDWLEYWAKTLAFDTLIGNTDRHQDNWGVIWEYMDDRAIPLRMTPVFDNGTSMGHEILKRKFYLFDNEEKIYKYVSRGCHHMKWSLDDQEKLSQAVLLQRLIAVYPTIRNVISSMINFDAKKLENDIMELVDFKVPCPLSYERARFIIKLLNFRRKSILSILGD